tara:strand:+ start:857 stop:1606 length:750 start_codon:yes stop_codon:yes gene_type:complete
MSVIPKYIFIIPYRDREEHKVFFLNYMRDTVLKNINNYEIYLSYQRDNRMFNRGAVKNLGFLACVGKYPNDWQNINFIFNDIDVIPYDKDVFIYETQIGKIIHNYGYNFTLGGCVVIKGIDFMRINGYPNIWTYGLEDNMLEFRAKGAGIKIDRNNMHEITSKKVLHLFDSNYRNVTTETLDTIKKEYWYDGLNTLKDKKYSIDGNIINIYNFNGLKDLRTVKYNKVDINNLETIQTTEEKSKKRFSLF